MNSIETTAAVFGFLCVVFTVRQNVWCWPTGLVQVFLYIFVFYRVKLYSDMILHVIYVYMQIYGWRNWLRGGENRSELPVSDLSGKALAACVFLCAVATASTGYAMASFTDASVPYFDAFTTAASLIAQWLMAKKKIESWYFWISVDIVAIGVYYYKDLFFTSALYATFLILAVSGLIAWQRSFAALRPSVHAASQTQA